MFFTDILRYVIFNSKLLKFLVLSAKSIFNDLTLVLISDSDPPPPSFPVPLPPLDLHNPNHPWQSFVYNFGHYSRPPSLIEFHSVDNNLTLRMFVFNNLVRSSLEHEIFHFVASGLCELDNFSQLTEV